MDAIAPTVVTIPVSCAPKKAPCPHCGRLAKRVRTHQRDVRTIAYKKIAILHITCGEYQARCGCCSTFRTLPDGVLPRWKYDNNVRQAVLDRILDDGMNVEATLRSLQRDFCLELSSGFVYDCLYDAAARLNLSTHREQILQVFSGTLCIDELHLGQYTLLLATDPLADIPVAFALVKDNDQAHMRRFLKNLKDWGLMPTTVVTDGSFLYPKVLAELWPEAEHQLCVFHVLQDLHHKILDAVKRLRRRLSARSGWGRKRRRGRLSKAERRQRQRRGKTAKEKAHFIFKHRHLLVKRRDHLTVTDCKDLVTMLGYLPELRTLRAFADALQKLFDPKQREFQAWGRWKYLQRHAKYLAVPELKEALAMLDKDKFRKMIAFLRSPVAKRVRTNNHVERCNRKLRHWEKVRYKWRRRRTLVRFLVLALDHWWKRVLPALTTKARKRASKRRIGRLTVKTGPPESGKRPKAA
jgi:hypothetical protein